MITLYKFIPAWGLPDLSPFCFKLETYLRMANVPYEAKVGDVRKAPKKKLPYIEHDGKTISDSGIVIEYLKSAFGDPLDAHLKEHAKERAIATAFRSMIEEQLYFVLLFERWQIDENWATYVPTMREMLRAASVPSWLHPVVLASARRSVVKSIHAQGTGRYSRAEVVTIGRGIVDAIADAMGEGPYFFGSAPTSLDATVYSFLASLMDAPFASPVKDHALGIAGLRAYCERMKVRYWTA